MYTILQINPWEITMTVTALYPLNAPPAKDWSCIFCHKQGDDFDRIDLITHEGCHERCIFHRMCYPQSKSAANGECEKCGTPLHEGRITYFASEADKYQMRDTAKAVRVSKRIEKAGLPFTEENFSTIVRSDSWDGSHLMASVEDVETVCEHMEELDSRDS